MPRTCKEKHQSCRLPKSRIYHSPPLLFQALRLRELENRQSDCITATGQFILLDSGYLLKLKDRCFEVTIAREMQRFEYLLTGRWNLGRK